jgi:hypothetical protein
LSGLTIPKSDRAGLSILREMPDAALSSFLVAIEKAPHAVPEIPGISNEEVSQVKEALDTMYGIRAYHDVPLDQFIDDVCESLREHKELKPEDERRLRERLNRLLDIDALIVAAKATVLRQEHERNFCSLRIITDARPVYANGISGPPSAMVITHTMKLSYHEGAGGHLSDLYLSFGPEDIAEIRAALTRAEEKTKSLREVFATAQIRLLDSLE